MILDNILLISIALVFIGALLGGYLQRRKKDRVLKDMDGYHITARRKNGSLVWGKAMIYPNAVELFFTRPFTNDHENKIVSYIMFSDKIDTLLGFFRYHDELTPKNQQQRLSEVDRVINRPWWSVIIRQTINFINTFRDAINESMGLLMSRMKGAGGSSAIFNSQNDRLKKISSQAVGMVGSSWDPVLERYIGRRVVVELIQEEKDLEEYAGFLKEYSQSWLSLFDCRLPERMVLPLDDIKRMEMQRLMDFTLTYSLVDSTIILTLEVINNSEQRIRFKKLTGVEYNKRLNKSLAPGESKTWVFNTLPEKMTAILDKASLPLVTHLVAPKSIEAEDEYENKPEIILPSLSLTFDLVREVDVLLPKHLATLRHAGEYIDT